MPYVGVGHYTIYLMHLYMKQVVVKLELRIILGVLPYTPSKTIYWYLHNEIDASNEIQTHNATCNNP